MTDCYFCGTPLAPGPLYRTSLCPVCGKELKICFNCRFYDESSPNQCRETVVERVSDKDRANFCEHFSPGKNGVPRKAGEKSQSGRKAFEDLFGNG